MNKEWLDRWNERAEWVKFGMDKGWVSDSFCVTHDGYLHMTEEDMEEDAEGGDPCYLVLKVL